MLECFNNLYSAIASIITEVSTSNNLMKQVFFCNYVFPEMNKFIKKNVKIIFMSYCFKKNN